MTPGEAKGKLWLGTSRPALPQDVAEHTSSLSNSVTLSPLSARKYALFTPIEPAPITTTSVLAVIVDPYYRSKLDRNTTTVTLERSVSVTESGSNESNPTEYLPNFLYVGFV